MELIILRQVERELREAPKDIIQDVFALFVIYAAAKKSQKIDRKMIEVIKARARSLNL